MIRAALSERGNPRKKVLIPDSAHGTNPASAVICGYTVETVPSNSDGMTDLDQLRRHMSEDVAAFMLTNPNTLGKFEQSIQQICDIVHDGGGFVYMDGANMNALAGVAQARELWHRRDAFESSQNVFDSARRGRSGRRSGRGDQRARALSSLPSNLSRGR